MMDNDPNRNTNNNHNNDQNNRLAAKEQPYDGSRRGGRGGGNDETDGQPMDIMGDLNEAPAAVVMFFVGVVAWLLREQCVC